MAENLARVRERIEAAAARVGRDASEVGLCAVTKSVGVSGVREAVAAGCRLLGESRVQDAESKIAEVSDLAVEWHMIGHLQRNKARKAVQLFDLVQSVDGVPLAKRLAALGEERGRPVAAYVEVLTSDEGTKSGLPLAGAVEAVAEMRELPGLDVRGLMTMAPLTEDESAVRASFRTLRELRDRLDPAFALSMGMTGDFELAVEEGATLVRLGTALFR